MKLLSFIRPRTGSGYFKNQGENKDQYPTEVWVTVQGTINPILKETQEAVEKHTQCKLRYLGIGRSPNELRFIQAVSD